MYKLYLVKSVNYWEVIDLWVFMFQELFSFHYNKYDIYKYTVQNSS